MKAKSMAVATLCRPLTAGKAAGDLHQDQDGFGVCFDTFGIAKEISVGPFVPYNAYLLVLSPSAPIDAFECTVTRVAAPCFVLLQNLGEGAVDADATADGFPVACINANCVSADEPTTFGAIRSLYR